MAYNNINPQSSGQQHFIPGSQAAFTPGVNDFPSFGGEGSQNNAANSQQQVSLSGIPVVANDNPFANSSAEFNPFASKDFVPGNPIIKEEFPDLDQAFGVPQKKKKGPTKEEIEAQKKAAIEALSTKGKPESFFYHQGWNVPPNMEQMQFIWANYPQYSLTPHTILDWLVTEAQRIVQAAAYEEQQKAIQQAYERGPQRFGNNNNNEDYDGEDYDEDTSFGVQGKNKKKQSVALKSSQSQSQGKKDSRSETKPPVEEVKKVKVVKDVVVKVDDETIIKVDESKQPCSLVFIGHVDAGKSTISGQIMLLMGCVDERTIEKYKKEAKDKGRDSWWLAYCMDVGEEEKAKGKTVEVGRATFNTPTKQFTVFDAPGHKNYVPNMIMGAALADYAGLVISARKGEYEAGFEKDGQTREHVQLAKSLGVQKIVVVVNKMDDHSVGWSETRWKEIQTNLLPFLNKSGYKDSDVFFVPISGLTGDNILNPVGEKCTWYKGPTLMEILDNLPVETRDSNGPLRIPILDKMKEGGVIAHGKIESGSIRIGDKIMISPSGYPAQVGAILDHKNENVLFARPGENVQIKLIHIDDENMINKGDVITGRDLQMPVTMLFEADVELFELLDYKPIVSKGYTCMMHCHTFADECVIKDIISCQEKNHTSGNMETKEAPKFVKSFTTCRVRITTRNPIAIEKFETIPQLGRFTLRDEGKTIAAGKILKYKPHTVLTAITVVPLPKCPTEPTATGAAKDKNETLTYDPETGTTGVANKPTESIKEADNEEEDKE